MNGQCGRRPSEDNCLCGGGASHRIVKERDSVQFGAASAGLFPMTLGATSAEARFTNEKEDELHLASLPAP